MTFLVLDVETANFDVSSICQIGVARYEQDELVGEWQSLIDPQTSFNKKNISIHGITENDVIGAPLFDQVYKSLAEHMRNGVVISHTLFDQSSLQKAFFNLGFDLPPCIWVDSAEVARTAWPQYSHKGFGLANICGVIGYQFQHHNALEDAKAAANVIFAAMREMNCTFQEIVEIGYSPVEKKTYSKKKLSTIPQDYKISGNPDGEMYGHQIVFTGQLTISRGEASQLAASAGCQVHNNITKKTTILVVGEQDANLLAGHSKSSKHRKAEEYISKGIPIRIIGESSFMETFSRRT